MDFRTFYSNMQLRSADSQSTHQLPTRLTNTYRDFTSDTMTSSSHSASSMSSTAVVDNDDSTGDAFADDEWSDSALCLNSSREEVFGVGPSIPGVGEGLVVHAGLKRSRSHSDRSSSMTDSTCMGSSPHDFRATSCYLTQPKRPRSFSTDGPTVTSRYANSSSGSGIQFCRKKNRARRRKGGISSLAASNTHHDLARKFTQAHACLDKSHMAKSFLETKRGQLQRPQWPVSDDVSTTSLRLNNGGHGDRAVCSLGRVNRADPACSSHTTQLSFRGLFDRHSKRTCIQPSLFQSTATSSQGQRSLSSDEHHHTESLCFSNPLFGGSTPPNRKTKNTIPNIQVTPPRRAKVMSPYSTTSPRLKVVSKVTPPNRVKVALKVRSPHTAKAIAAQDGDSEMERVISADLRCRLSHIVISDRSG